MSGLAPGIVRIPTRGDGDNCFLVEEEDGLTRVDVGWKNAPVVIRQAVEAAGRTLSDITRIVITHAHPDHVRGLAELLARTGGADVFIHELEQPWLAAGRVSPHGRSGALGRAIDHLPLLHWQPVAAARTVTSGQAVGSLRVIHTPGHSPGHIMLLHEPTRTLLVGDAVFHRSGLTLGPAALAADPAARPASLLRMPRDVRAVGFAHGKPLSGERVSAFHDFCQAIEDTAARQ
ncbi:MBL fold metallo-hydrolase [Streptomyces sp. NPDC001507]|uniref:MBL fold metallo-hydrolase n=1 Tax=Streptomyces sp. NPDC001507 TaxID=3364579 RepID=UPI0036CAD499